ncbi:MAG: CotH kinase family protein [Bacteroidia bacterium]|nr:CotH kinase family protein [Bacteroidia bacterium]
MNTFLKDARIASPDVDIRTGYFTAAPVLHLSCSEADHTIYYTLDGSSPENSLAMVYDGNSIQLPDEALKDTFLYTIPTSPRWQLPLDKTYCFPVLRAVCVDKTGKCGKELVESYIIDPQKNHNYSISLASFVFDQDQLFGYENGIYVMGKKYEDKDNYIKKKIKFDIPWWKYPANYLDKGSSSDRMVNLSLGKLNKTCFMQKSSKIRIHGFNTRGFAQKSIRVSWLASPDSSAKCIAMLNTASTETNFVFRNGGNDWTKTLLRDAFVHRVMKNSSLSAQQYEPVVCFFNGEYWGIHTLRERFDDTYIFNHYGISKDSIALLELNGQVVEGGKSDANDYLSLIDYILSNDLSDDQKFAVVEKEMDIANLIDYYLCNMFFVNNDWPHNNCKYWRYSYPAKDSVFRDKKWRFVVYDMDWAMGFNINKAYEFNMFEYLKKENRMGKVFYSLLKNVSFKNRLRSRAEYLLKNEFSERTLIATFTSMEEEISPFMDEHIKRWRVIGSKQNWEKNMSDLKNFLTKRPKIFLEQLNSILNK